MSCLKECLRIPSDEKDFVSVCRFCFVVDASVDRVKCVWHGLSPHYPEVWGFRSTFLGLSHSWETAYNPRRSDLPGKTPVC